MPGVEKPFHAFLSHSHEDAEWVEKLASRLTDECKFQVWLDKWLLVPGKSWQQGIARGLQEAASCAVCIGGKTPRGWFREEIERALDIQTQDEEFRVIPVLLPDGDAEYVSSFLRLRTWSDFRAGEDEEFAFHVLKQGIKGEPIGRWPPPNVGEEADVMNKTQARLAQLLKLRKLGLHDEVVIEYERKILAQWLQ